MYYITKEVRFEYGHKLNNYKGKCFRVHGHNGRVLITLKSEKLDEVGFVIDFKDIKEIAQRVIIEKYDHYFLNDIPPFNLMEPTAENMSAVFYNSLKKEFKDDIQLDSVTVYETDDACATFREN